MARFKMERIDNELLLFDPAQTKILYCNETAALIWELCDGERTGDEIIAMLKEVYPDAGETIARDVETTLRLFSQHGAIDFVWSSDAS
jgi:hypothetical protein